jgi:uncharacterized 2Fe-2S/4Fe-4S cluster protein (DUF4445 family)
MAHCEVKFLPSEKIVQVESGVTLLEAAGKAGITLHHLCGGHGQCGRCRMSIVEGNVSGGSSSILSSEETDNGIVLSCIAHVEGNITAEIPDTTRVGDRIELDEDAERFITDFPGIARKEFSAKPLVTKIYMELDKPTLDSNFADADRVKRQLLKATGAQSAGISLEVLKKLPSVLRDGDFSVTVTAFRCESYIEVLDVEKGDTRERGYIAVVDVGTTTVVTNLVRTSDLVTIEKEACFNAQAVYGREVTARIMAAEKKGVDKLQELVVGDINRLVLEMVERAGVALDDVLAVVCSGNTTMIHFLLGLPTANIRRDPFISVVADVPSLNASDVGLKIKDQGRLYVVPGIGSWVGGDLTAGILATGLHEKENISMLIDVGTNGEIIVGNNEWLMACSASTGPALEGGSVECGMMGERGAIEKVFESDGKVEFQVIGDCDPAGICGSGIIDLLAVMLGKGIVDRSGRFVEGSDPDVEFIEDRGRYTIPGSGVFMTQDDVDNIITAKAAIFAALKIMLDRLNIGFSDLESLYIAGGFGGFIDIANAQKIGLLPGIPAAKIQYAGNTALLGAKLAAMSLDAFNEMGEIVAKTTYFDLMGTSDYVEQFGQAQFLPHTDISLFASE